ncbi:MAG TPA: sigma-70 family RNA polymerase sigma factor [Myxococcales bacterium]|nr:sigma-70 family RNA polymerase sigma factor [Myxococcales bacterium]
MLAAPLTLATPKAEAAPSVPSVAEIYRLHAGDVTRWVARLGGPRMELEDAVQEVFVIVQRELPRFRGEARLTTWLYRITENVVRHQRRRRRWLGWLRKDEDPPEPVSPDRSPLEDAEARQSRELVYRALDGMNERYRTAIILFEIEDLPGEEVAERMGVKLGNLWVLLHRARADLTRRLGELTEAEP